jgi:uncharacterized protein YwgA
MSSGISRGSATVGLLRILEANGGRLDGRIALQKIAFLLKVKGLADFVDVPFSYNTHGPSSRQFSAVLHEVIVNGLVVEKPLSVSDDDGQYTYELTEAGRELLGHLGPPDERLSAAVRLAAAQKWPTLELAATVLFFERDRQTKTRDKALDRALELRPTRAAYSDGAKQILAAMQL